MKQISNIIFVFALLMVAMTSCIENEPVVFDESVAEFDAAVWNTPATGQTYPILTRVPGFGRAVSTNATAPSTADPAITRGSGTINFRVNLVGPPATSEQTLAVSVVSENSTATAGVHYTAPTSVVIPAGENFGTLSVPILNPGASTGSVIVVLQLDGNSTVLPSENYKRIGISIAQN
ncbi:MAG TPA: DUF4843 domain-containing protein [Chryseosolibacter sp.]